MNLPFYTVGHSTKTIDDFAALLKAGAVEVVVDIRTIPRSRTNPQFNEDGLPASLEPHGLAYRRIAALGGLRGKAHDVPAEVNGFWENASFHNYADYALSPAFRSGLQTLVELGREKRCAVMCSEAVWWRCHRRIVADYLLARGETVFHLMAGERVDEARLTPGASVGAPDIVRYPARPAQA
ncbi:DUF488 family protein [Caballeronia sp. Lep1P3]|uniref:DUF488 domain-containing protein n=1 Tax=Caballeronia sp. Lep1P3 TaxID=2878150 RepID=UPI001FD5EE0F|nr:DUF488 domain-containing protein [Caballeronia sp. Lep1P3]